MRAVRRIIYSEFGLWAVYGVVFAVAVAFVFLVLPGPIRARGLLLLFGGVAAFLVTALAAAPLFRFLAQGWPVRFAEIRATLSAEELAAYLGHFWPERT
jgi:hypothetical protein